MGGSITSTELNYLVFRYLHESGFIHSAFALGYEAGINKSTIDGNLVPPGALVTFVQKGLQYLELEANLSSSEVDVDEDFSFLQPLDLITKDVNQLRQIIKEKKETLQKEGDKDKEKEKEADRELERERARERERDRLEREKERERERERERQERDKERERERQEREKERERERERQEREKERERERERQEKEKERERERERQEREKDREKIEKEKEREKEKEKEKEKQHEQHDELVRDREDKFKIKLEENVGYGGPEPMDATTSTPSVSCEIPSSDVTILEGHTSEVFACAWSPEGSLLASGSGDATARIWTIADGPCSSSVQSGGQRVLVLKHFKGRTNEKCKDVTTLDWNGEGTLLATGSYDGHARIWSRDGELKNMLSKHRGPIFSLKWNKKGDLLLSGSVDKTAIVWDLKTGEGKQQFEFHTAPTLDVDWRNNASFATCSTDNMIYVCKLGEGRPLKSFSGHLGEVNAIKWDPTGSLLASCSDDVTAKIWSMKQDKCVHDLKEHTKEIYTIRWSPTGPGTNNPNQPSLLASASFDSTIKLWDVEQGRLLYNLNSHRDPVYSVAFSPNGEYLVSGSLDRCLHVWSVREGKVVKTYRGSGGIFEVCWNKEGDKIAACFSNNTVCVLDFRM